MKYSLLDYLCCSYCSSDLTCLALSTNGDNSDSGKPYMMMDVLAEFPKETPLVEMIEHLEESAESIERDDNREIKEGVLICGQCGHWFPIYDFIPELLPDHLRNWEHDLTFFNSLEKKLPGDIFKELLDKSKIFASQVFAVEDGGVNFKKSEISIKSKVTEDEFFGPGYSSPFNPGNTEYTIHLIRRLGNVLPLLELKPGDVVLDIGVGYSWTTEWLMKMGVEPIGVDICRTYLDIGVRRMGKKLPHLVVGDIENLPIKDKCLNAIMCYDSFHHIPNRNKAMQHFFRTMGDYGNIVLAEPGGTHELAKVSRDVMDKYGILEKGMDLEDVVDYCEELDFDPPEQHYVMKVQRGKEPKSLTQEFIFNNTYVDCNIFVVKKRLGEREPGAHSSSFKSKVKIKIKRLLKRVFFKLLH
ncbi:MAG: methyltransferase domain-containing protein [bacterium]|nr:methyltransferase domain-containing protein [bacterium]